MKKKVVALDMDDTILWLMRAIQEDHNKKHPEHFVPYEKVVAFDESWPHPDYDKMEFFNAPDVFFDLEIMDEYTVEEIEKIHQDYDLIIVTSAFPETVVDKWRWLQKHLPFIPAKNFITCSRKDLIEADILIDDAIHNVKDWVAKGKPALVPSHHWNQDLKDMQGVTMFYGWHGLKEILDHVLYYSEVR